MLFDNLIAFFAAAAHSVPLKLVHVKTDTVQSQDVIAHQSATCSVLTIKCITVLSIKKVFLSGLS